jgi:hypothetical protein
MRILFLTILIVFPTWLYMRGGPVPKSPEKIDSIRIKMGAPSRQQRVLTLQQEESPKYDLSPEEENPSEEEQEEEGAERSPGGDIDQVEEVEWTDLEEGWNTELKSMLNRLEPADGDDIYKTYMKEQESYQTEIDALMNERHQKTSRDAALEIDQLIAQLDSKHQDRLKEILGAHYEAVRDQYQQYMESQPEE